MKNGDIPHLLAKGAGPQPMRSGPFDREWMMEVAVQWQGDRAHLPPKRDIAARTKRHSVEIGMSAI